MEAISPIVIFVYNRPWHTKRLLGSLDICYQRCPVDHPIYIFLDGPQNEETKASVADVANVVKQWKDTTSYSKVCLQMAETNQGLANSIISGISQVLLRHDSVIVLEDDLVLDGGALDYFQKALAYYQDDLSVASISGFSHPIPKKKLGTNRIYRSRTGNCWGWATWKNNWDQMDWEVKDYPLFAANKNLQKKFDEIQYGITNMLIRQQRGEISSWAVRWDYFFFKKNWWTIYPAQSLVLNEGFDGSGTNCGINVFEQNKGAQELMPEGENIAAFFAPLDQLPDLTAVTAAATKETLMQKVQRRWIAWWGGGQ